MCWNDGSSHQVIKSWISHIHREEVLAPLRAAFQRMDGWCPDGLLTALALENQVHYFLPQSRNLRFMDMYDLCRYVSCFVCSHFFCMLRDFLFAWLLPSGSNHVEQGWWYSISYFICLTWSIEPSNLAAVTAREKTSQWIMNLTLWKPWIMNVNRSF